MAKAHLLLEQWSKGLAGLVGTTGHPQFAARLLDAVRRLVDFDFVMAFAYSGKSAPLLLGDTLDKPRHRIIAVDYASGPYLLDPFYQLTVKGTQAGCYRLNDIAPDHFRRSEYFRVHYGRTSIGEEVGFYFPMEAGWTGVVSLSRWNQSPALTKAELEILRSVAAAVSALAAQHWQSAGQLGWIKGRQRPKVTNLGMHALSAREREIVTMILQGHSTESVALQLAISPGTVKIHRKNIYRKLKISTQAELFAAFLGFAAPSEAYSPGDIPEQAYIPQSVIKMPTGG